MNEPLYRRVIDHALETINRIEGRPYALRGGTALLECYGLDRFSEGIELDAEYAHRGTRALFDTVKELCSAESCTWSIGEGTDTAQRVTVNLPDGTPLQIEASYRRRSIPASSTCVRNGYRVYTIDEICRMKCAAYLSRDTIRDLYDVTFICDRYYDRLSQSSKDALLNTFEYKDLSQFDYLVQTSDDPFIDKDLLAERFLKAYEKVGLMAPTADGGVTGINGRDAGLTGKDRN